MNRNNVLKILDYFDLPGELGSIAPFKVGHINQTYVSTRKVAGKQKRFLHQMVNRYVFKDVPAVMKNIEVVIAHIKARAAVPERETLTIVPTKNSASYLLTNEGEYWRTYSFIEDTVSYEVCKSSQDAYQAAKVMGRFLKYLSDAKISDYVETIYRFQSVPYRFEELKQAISDDCVARVDEVSTLIEFALAREENAALIDQHLTSGEIPLRVTHSDPKFNNILFDKLPGEKRSQAKSGNGLAIVDLDTVMPGNMLYDFGDLARSVVIAAPEDETELSRIKINLQLFKELVDGYLGEVGDILTPKERQLMPQATQLIALSLGVRFLSDYLNGDVYFKVHREKHNLDRARAQFQIVKECEESIGKMEELVKGWERAR
jgi:hypothetical protein